MQLREIFIATSRFNTKDTTQYDGRINHCRFWWTRSTLYG